MAFTINIVTAGLGVGVILLYGLMIGSATLRRYLWSLIPAASETSWIPAPTLKPPLEVWYQGTKHDYLAETEIDIIAVHGLDANTDGAWTRKSKDGHENVNWLRDPDMLPSILPKARIIVYTYNSAWMSSAPKMALRRCGEDMMCRTHDFRSRDNKRPVIFIGHSLGGVVIEYGLIYARRQQELQYLTETTIGCVFLGTPFRGSNAMAISSRVASMFQTRTISNLAYENDELTDTLHEFTNLVQSTSIPVVSFFETLATNFSGQLIVPKESATNPGWRRLALPSNHSNMNKFLGPNDPSYLIVSTEIQNMYNVRNVVLRKAARKRDNYTPQFMVPFGRNEHFVGYEAILCQLLRRIPPDANYDTCRRTALEGLGGAGKTQLALEAVYRLRDQDPACSIFWVSASDSTKFERDYYTIGQRLQVPGIDDYKVDIKQLIKDALSRDERVDKWLLVIDGIDNPDLFFRVSSLGRFLPFSRNGSILLTTRSHQVAVGLGAMIIEVEPMVMQEALQLLRSSVEPGLIENENHISTIELLRSSTYLPLAISQISAYLSKYRVSSTQYLKVLRSKHDNMIDLLSQDFETHGRYDSQYNPVATTFIVSFEQLRQSNTLAIEYLQLISFLDEIEIPYAVLPSSRGDIEMMEAIGGLKAFTFIRQRSEDFFDTHRLVQASVRRWIMINGDWDRSLQVAVDRLNEILPLPDYKTKHVWIRYVPHVLSVLSLAGDVARKSNPDMLQLKNKAGLWLNELGRYGEAAAIFQQVLESQRDQLGEECTEIFSTMNNIAAMFFHQRRCEEAMRMAGRVLEFRRKMLGSDHLDLLSSMNNLAVLLATSGRFKDAESLQRNVFEQRCVKLGGGHPGTLSALNNLAAILFQQERFEEVTDMFAEVLNLEEEIFGGYHPDILTSMNNLASTFQSTGRLEEAAKLQRKVLEQRDLALGAEHPSTLSAMNNLATTLFRQGMFEEAMSIFINVLEFRKKVLGGDHPDVLTSMNNLVSTFQCTGRLEEAARLQSTVVEQKGLALGAEHPGTLSATSNLVMSLSQQARIEQADEKQLEARKKMQQNLGPRDQETTAVAPEIMPMVEHSNVEHRMEVET